MLEQSSARELDLNRAWIQPESDNQKTILHKFSTFFPQETALKGSYNLSD